jgi:PAS domain S-box-containing protein
LDKSDIIEVGKITGAATGAIVGGWNFWEKIWKPYIIGAREKKKNMYDMISYIHSEIPGIKENQVIIFDKLYDLEQTQKIQSLLKKEAFFYSDESGGCYYASPMLTEYMGHSEQEIHGYNWVNCVYEPDRARVRKHWEETIEDRTVFDVAFSYRQKHGEIQPITCTAIHKYDKNGDYAGSNGYVYLNGEKYKP